MNNNDEMKNNNNNEKNNHNVATENFYCKSGFSFAAFCGISRFFRCRLPAWLLFTFCFTQNSTGFSFSWSPLACPIPFLPLLETKWCSWLRPSAKMFVATQRQRRRRQVVPKEQSPSPITPSPSSYYIWVRVQQTADAKKPRADIEMRRKHSRTVSECRTND